MTDQNLTLQTADQRDRCREILMAALVLNGPDEADEEEDNVFNIM